MYIQILLLPKMAPKRLKRNLSLLDVLQKANKAQRSAIINTATTDQLQCICDCASNILNENVKITETELKRLKRYQNHIRFLANNNGNPDKKKIIIQEGGFLPLLLTPILSVAGSLLADVISKSITK